uniref:Putative ml domain protein n=1 Tax=Lutzomyia longipalpis TaxID=7200 RepID=A0A7G3AQE3_LUTLO
MFRFLFVIVFLSIVVQADYIIHHPCVFSHGSTPPPVPNWVWVEGCNESGCSVPNGSTRKVRTGFYPLSTHYRLHGYVRTFFLGIEFPIEQPDELYNLCDHIEDGCPIYVGRERSAELTIQGYSPISGVTVRVEITVTDKDTDEIVACGGIYSHPGNTPPTAAWVEVADCTGSTCNIVNGAATPLRAAFAPTTNHNSLGFYVRVFLLGISVPIEQPPGLDQACDLIQGGCPIVAGQGETIASMVFQQTSPLAGLTVRIEVDLRDHDTGESVVCAGVQVTIISAE